MLEKLFSRKKTVTYKELADQVLGNILKNIDKITETFVLELHNQCGVNPNDINQNLLTTELTCMIIAVDLKGLPHLLNDITKARLISEYSTNEYFYHIEDVDFRNYIIEGIKVYSDLFDKAIAEEKYFDTYLYSQIMVKSLGESANKYGFNEIQHNYFSKTFQPIVLGYWRHGLKYFNIKY